MVAMRTALADEMAEQRALQDAELNAAYSEELAAMRADLDSSSTELAAAQAQNEVGHSK